MVPNPRHGFQPLRDELADDLRKQFGKMFVRHLTAGCDLCAREDAHRARMRRIHTAYARKRR